MLPCLQYREMNFVGQSLLVYNITAVNYTDSSSLIWATLQDFSFFILFYIFFIMLYRMHLTCCFKSVLILLDFKGGQDVVNSPHFYMWHDQGEWVTCRQYSILKSQYNLQSLVHLKCYILIQIPSQSNIWLQI